MKITVNNENFYKSWFFNEVFLELGFGMLQMGRGGAGEGGMIGGAA
jgi:hypothetical protein